MEKISYINLSEDCFILDKTKYDFYKIINGRKTYINKDRDRIFYWDNQKGHVEEFNKRGNHLAVLDKLGNRIKKGIKKRHINTN